MANTESFLAVTGNTFRHSPPVQRTHFYNKHLLMLYSITFIEPEKSRQYESLQVLENEPPSFAVSQK